MYIKHRLTSRLLSLIIALMICSQTMAQTPKERSRYFCGKGEVVSIAEDAMSIVIRHERIEDFMEAMTMRFKAEDRDVIEGLTPGDRVRFTLRDTPTLTRLVFIEKIAADK
ncbi:MAG: copper-binding protein [Acidobacteriota bacterium]